MTANRLTTSYRAATALPGASTGITTHAGVDHDSAVADLGSVAIQRWPVAQRTRAADRHERLADFLVAAKRADLVAIHLESHAHAVRMGLAVDLGVVRAGEIDRDI